MRILFNIPVHENMDVVVNTVDNIRRYVEKPIIIFHVNPIFTSFDHHRLRSDFPVYVNPHRFEFIKYQSILHILMANYYHSQHIDYDYHCFFYSNEMFIRSGIEQYVNGYQCVFENHFHPHSTARHEEMKAACSLPGFFDNQPFINNHVEGTMYSRELIGKIFDFIKSNLMDLLMSTTSIEETVIPTLAYMFTSPQQRQAPYNLFQDWDRELTVDQLHELFQPQKPILVGHTAYGHTGVSDQIFTIKPVHRHMQSQLRQAINRL